jgi:hypothetical protein
MGFVEEVVGGLDDGGDVSDDARVKDHGAQEGHLGLGGVGRRAVEELLEAHLDRGATLARAATGVRVIGFAQGHRVSVACGLPPDDSVAWRLSVERGWG